MTEIVYYVATSLDGYIATLGDGIDWLDNFNVEGEDYGYAAFYDAIDALVMGRRTYEKVVSFGEWVYPGKPCWVCSQQALKPAAPEVTVTAASPSEVVAELQSRNLRRVWLVGGGALATAFSSSGLLNEYILSVMPIVLGSGIPLLTSSDQRRSLQLLTSKTYPNGVVQLHYAQP